MAARWSTGKQSSRSTDTPSRWTNATARRTASGREMGPTVYDLPPLGHAKTYTQVDFLVRLLRARVPGRHAGAAQRLRGRIRARQRLRRPSHQPDRAPAAGGPDAIRARSSTRNWSRSFIAWAVR